MWQVTYDMWQMTGDMWQVTYDMWQVTYDMWQVTYDMWQVTCGMWQSIVVISVHKHSLSRVTLNPGHKPLFVEYFFSFGYVNNSLRGAGLGINPSLPE